MGGDVLQYEGKRVIVTGAASGMGAATAQILVELGAEVHAIDIKKPDVAGLASFTECDLREPEQVDEAVNKIGKIVNALFNCAGLPNTFPNLDVMLVNFCGLRQVTEAVIPNMPQGSAIACIASTAGIGWLQNMGLLFELRERDSHQLHQPGPTDTPMMPEFEKAVGKKFMDDFPIPLGRHAVAEEQAWPLVFLNSPRASYLTGHQLDVDGGFKGGLFTGQIDASVLMPDQ